MQAARETHMTAKIWQRADNEIRVYLKRTNAAATEAGYIRIYTKDGKIFAEYVPDNRGGAGSRTASAEGRAAFAKYGEMRAAAQMLPGKEVAK